MKVGEEVLVYEDPITMARVEGKATLLQKTETPDVDLEDGSHLEFWIVVFPDNEQAYRKIKVKPEGDDRT